ncbi:MAG: enoyl-CoA hydratase/isomerase family protein, partial [Flavobacterium sp.]
MNYENILIELENNIATLTINRPSKLNALNIDTINDLHKAIKTLGKNKEIQVILLTGSGEKAFVAGADISEFAHFTIEEGAQLASEGQ